MPRCVAMILPCPYPKCAGALRTGTTSGYCLHCRQPVNACAQCGAWNRAFARVCRQCGREGTIWRQVDPGDPGDPISPEALGTDPRRSELPQQVLTAPQAAAGFVWAMGEGGDLYRLNPYAAAREQVEVHDRFWAEPQPHAFALSRLRLPFGGTAEPGASPQSEDCAVVAMRDRIAVSGLFSKRRRSFLAAAGESFLAEARERFQSVAADGSSRYVLSRHAGQICLCECDLVRGNKRAAIVAQDDTAVCGPVLLPQGEGAAAVVVWARTQLWVYVGGELAAVALPEAVELATAPQESGLRLPPGRSPAIAGPGFLTLAARQFGRPALLRLTPSTGGWSVTMIAVLEDGTLGANTAGQPLLSTAEGLLLCTGPAFRRWVPDLQIATRLPAWAHAGLAVFFCEVEYRGLKQWVKAYAEGTELSVSWNVPAGAEVHACAGFQTVGTALGCLCVLTDQGLRTEFLSWCV